MESFKASSGLRKVIDRFFPSGKDNQKTKFEESLILMREKKSKQGPEKVTVPPEALWQTYGNEYRETLIGLSEDVSFINSAGESAVSQSRRMQSIDTAQKEILRDMIPASTARLDTLENELLKVPEEQLRTLAQGYAHASRQEVEQLVSDLLSQRLKLNYPERAEINVIDIKLSRLIAARLLCLKNEKIDTVHIDIPVDIKSETSVQLVSYKAAQPTAKNSTVSEFADSDPTITSKVERAAELAIHNARAQTQVEKGSGVSFQDNESNITTIGPDTEPDVREAILKARTERMLTDYTEQTTALEIEIGLKRRHIRDLKKVASSKQIDAAETELQQLVFKLHNLRQIRPTSLSKEEEQLTRLLILDDEIKKVPYRELEGERARVLHKMRGALNAAMLEEMDLRDKKQMQMRGLAGATHRDLTPAGVMSPEGWQDPNIEKRRSAE